MRCPPHAARFVSPPQTADDKSHLAQAESSRSNDAQTRLETTRAANALLRALHSSEPIAVLSAPVDPDRGGLVKSSRSGLSPPVANLQLLRAFLFTVYRLYHIPSRRNPDTALDLARC